MYLVHLWQCNRGVFFVPSRLVKEVCEEYPEFFHAVLARSSTEILGCDYFLHRNLMLPKSVQESGEKKPF